MYYFWFLNVPDLFDTFILTLDLGTLKDLSRVVLPLNGIMSDDPIIIKININLIKRRHTCNSVGKSSFVIIK